MSTTESTAERPSAPPAAQPAVPRSRLIATLAVLASAAFLMIMNETVMTVALPAVMADFGVGAATVQWLTTGFLLTMAVVIPATGFLFTRLSVRTLFAAAVLVFLAGTALAAFGPSFAVVLVARVLQAAGTAIVLPLLMATTMARVPAHRRGMVMGLNAVVIAVGPAVGPTLAGIIMNVADWRWVFGSMIPLGVILLVGGLVAIRLPHTALPARLDAASLILAVAGFGGIVYALATLGHAAEPGGSFAPLAGAGAVGIAALAAFFVRQARLEPSGRALLPVSPFRLADFRNSLIVLSVAFATLIGTVVVLPIYLQDGLGLDVMTVGFMLLPGGVVQVVAAPIFGRLFDRFGPRPIAIPGAFAIAAGQWLLATLDETSSPGFVIACHVVFCLGFSMLMTSLMTTALAALPRELYGHGSAIVNTFQQLAGAAGTALMVALLSVGVAAQAADGAGPQAATAAGSPLAFVLGGALALVGVAAALRIRGRAR